MSLQLLIIRLIEQVLLLDCLQEPSLACSEHHCFFVFEGIRVELWILSELLLHEADQDLMIADGCL